MGYTVNKETMRLYKESTILSQQAHKFTKEAENLWQDIQDKLGKHAELMVAIGELNALLRLKDEELEEAVKRG